MRNGEKTKTQLIEELEELHALVAELRGESAEKSDSAHAEQREIRDALSESEKKYQAIFERSADAILIIEGDKFVDCNEATVKMLGYKNKQDLLDTHPSELSPETQPDGQSSFNKANEMMATALQRGSHRFEWAHKRRNGEVFPVEVLLTPFPYEGKDFLHVVWRDITERKRLEALESRAARLDTAGTIAGQVAHDFNNLLGPLMAYPELIRRQLPENHKTRKHLDQIETAATKIAAINQDLLTLGRRGHYNLEALNLNTVVQHTLATLERPATLSYVTDLSDELMPIQGGKAQLHRMLSNLLHNAEDAMQGIGKVHIKTENYYVDDMSIKRGYVPKGEYVKLTISDTGCGIPDDVAQKIFDPFFTTKPANAQRGSGLGMSVVDGVIKDHHGYIDLKTKVGAGTSFFIYFPISRDIVNESDSDEICGGSESILVVDDDDIQREVTFQLLSQIGYQVSTVESGEKAVAFLIEHPQDLVVLDMVMPGGIDGTETYRRILEINPQQKAMIFSGFSESDRVVDARKMGIGAFIKKPITLQKIATAVRRELESPETVSA